MKNRLIIIPLLVLCFSLAGQEDASYLYYRSVELYNKGRIDSAEHILSMCINEKQVLKESSRETRADIYHLSTQVNLLLNRPEVAGAHLKQMLKNNPYYKTEDHPDDLLEFKQMLGNITVRPKYSIGLYLFHHSSNNELVSSYSFHDGSNLDVTGSSGTGLGLLFESSIRNNIYWDFGINLFNTWYRCEGSAVPTSSSKYGELSSYFPNLNYLEFPFKAEYYFRIEKILKPYIHGGFIGRIFVPGSVMDVNLNDEYRISPYNLLSAEKYHLIDDNNRMLALFYRNYTSFDILIGGGMEYSYKRSGFNIWLQYIPSIPKIGYEGADYSLAEEIEDPYSSGEYYLLANDIITVRERTRIRFGVTYKYYLSFRAFNINVK